MNSNRKMRPVCQHARLIGKKKLTTGHGGSMPDNVSASKISLPLVSLRSQDMLEPNTLKQSVVFSKPRIEKKKRKKTHTIH